MLRIRGLLALFLTSIITTTWKVVEGSVITEGRVWTIAGSDTAGNANGPGPTSTFRNPGSIVGDGARLFISDTNNNCIRLMTGYTTTSPQVQTYAGLCAPAPVGNGAVDGPRLDSRFYMPRGLSIITGFPLLFVADSENHLVRQIHTGTGEVTTLGGKAGEEGFTDGAVAIAQFRNPWGVTFSTVAGLQGYLVADRHNHAIRRIDGGVVSTIASSVSNPGGADGPLATATLTYPSEMYAFGNKIYFVQAHSLRKIEGNVISTIAGTVQNGWADGALSSARFFDPRGLWVAPEGTVYISDKSHSLLRYVNVASGYVETLVGTGDPEPANVDGHTSIATLDQASGVWGTANPSQTTWFFISDTNHHRIKAATALCAKSCQNGGVCKETDKCDCTTAPGYTGKDCSVPQCSPTCTGGKICTAPNRCECPAGYTGPGCATPICNPTCANGVCVAPNTCNCTHGWGDADCSFAICNFACYHGSVCGAPDTCTCPPQWQGPQCEAPVCNMPCQHGSTCMAPDRCNCTQAPGWEGVACQIPICTQQCQNGGTCVGPDTCSCAPGWTGPLCETPICNFPCYNNGNCTLPNTCTCTSRWQGPQCQTPVCRKYKCFNGGVCSSPDNCTCTANYVGTNCTVPICDNPVCGLGQLCVAPDTCVSACAQTCVNGGYCTDINTCTCINGWKGHDCSKAYCRRYGCVRGSCVSPDNCVCNTGWSGDACDTAVCDQVTCQNGGLCIAPNFCACTRGWVGPNCDVPLCLKPFRPDDFWMNRTSDCTNGDCSTPNNCTCHVGWAGTFCEKPVCDIQCLNGGICTAPNTCKCQEYYEGLYCENYTKPEPSWLEKNWASVFPIILIGAIIIGMWLCWRARRIRDHLNRVNYQLEYDKKHKPNAGEYITDSEAERDQIASSSEDIEPRPNVVNKWTKGAVALRDDAKRALKGVVIDDADETSSTDLSSSIDEEEVFREEKKNPKGLVDRFFNRDKKRAKNADISTSASSSSDSDSMPGAVNRGRTPVRGKVVVEVSDDTSASDSESSSSD